MASFGAVTFGILIDSPDLPSVQAEVTEIKIPDGPSVLDVAGPGAGRLSFGIYFADGVSGYAGLRALVGTQATLTTPSGTYADAVLTNLKPAFIGPIGGEVKADAEFVYPEA